MAKNKEFSLENLEREKRQKKKPRTNLSKEKVIAEGISDKYPVKVAIRKQLKGYTWGVEALGRDGKEAFRLARKVEEQIRFEYENES